MVDAIAIREEQAPPDSPKERLKCVCGHRMLREECSSKIYMDEDGISGIPAEFEEETAREFIENHCFYQTECTECGSCCNTNNGDLRRDTDNEPSEWMCRECLEKYYDEEDAENCCEDDD